MQMHQPLEVFQLSTLAEFASLRLRWNELTAGIPLRSWEWLEKWWRIYGNTSREYPFKGDSAQSLVHKELYLLAVFEAPDRLVGIAPWYIEHSQNSGRTLRFLGSGEVCTDYSTILCEPGRERAVAAALARSLSDPLHVADWLTQNSVRHWDRIDFEATACDDVIMNQLLGELERHNNLVHRRPVDNTWRLSLPATWDAYLATLSKSHRKQIRRCQRDMLQSGRVKVSWVTDEQQFDEAWQLLVTLHQDRHRALGRPGSFHSERYFLFHRDLAREMLRTGNLWLGSVEVDGRPVAADYQFVSGDTVFAYQGGIDPRALDIGPGQLMIMASIRRAIDEGLRTFDFLRGDEPYKAHWRAKPHPAHHIRVVKRTPSNQVRKGLWVAGDHLKQWIKSSFGAPAGAF